ncbi:hypothetical protein GOBAR_DD23570 [Gossypium barbadense]|nr:hypothetical protein GOBAR_DD23570 [Gossypium barbadense]
MSSDSHFGIPIIELPTNSKDLDGGSDEWRSLCKSVREACENHGCFQVVYHKISSHLQHELFSLIRQPFNLPLETKKQNVKSKPLHGYYEPGGDFLPFYESFGLEDASSLVDERLSTAAGDEIFSASVGRVYEGGIGSYRQTLQCSTLRGWDFGA